MKNIKRVICAFICLLVIASYAVPASARGAVYSKPSDEYKKSQFAQNLEAVELTGDMRVDVIAVALSQLFYHEGDGEKDFGGANSSGDGNFVEYNYAYGKLDQEGNGKLTYGYPWCAAFVSFCLRRSLVPTSIAPTHVNCTSWVNMFKKGTKNYKFYEPGGYTPIMGDLIFFKNNNGTTRISDHVGLVLGVSDEYVFTIEGNTSGGVFTRVYELNASKIVGYAVPNYESGISSAQLIDDGTLMVSARETLNLRSQGNTSSTILGTLTYGTLVEVIDIKGGWANVKVDGKTGWVSMTYMLPEQFGRIKVTYSADGKSEKFFVGADTQFGLPIPEEKEGYEFLGYEADGVLYSKQTDGRIVLSSKKNITLKASYEKLPETTSPPETSSPEESGPVSDGEVNAPADTYGQLPEALPPDIAEGCGSTLAGTGTAILICVLGAIFTGRKKHR